MIPSILPTYNRAPLTFERGEGSWLVTPEGERYLDLAAGIAVNALGHAHPVLVETLTAQAQKVWHLSNLYQIPEQQKLADMLVERTFADTAFFTNSGTEACELAVKMARKYWSEADPARTRILTFEGAFHGRSSAAIAAAGSEKMTKGFGPLLPGFTQLPWGDHKALDAAIREADVGAVLVEPIQGEGGIRAMPDACLKGLRDLCDETGVLMILDEVQCGMGRTGRLFAHEWAGITPDIMMVAKGIGGAFLWERFWPPNARRRPWWRARTGRPMAATRWAVRWVRRSLASWESQASLQTSTARRDVPSGARVVGRGASGCVRGGARIGADARPEVQGGAGRGGEGGIWAHVLTVPAADNVVRILPALNIPDADIAEALMRLDRAAAAVQVGAAA